MRKAKNLEIILLILILLIFIFLLYDYKKIETEFFHQYIYLYEKYYPVETESLDLTSISNDDNLASLYDRLPEFKKLKIINFGDFTIDKTTKDNLVRRYPEMEFNVLYTTNIYGVDYREDITELDLSNQTIDDKLSEYLLLLPKLEKVNLTNTNLSNFEKLTLKNNFPNIQFNWEIKLNNNIYDINVTELDFTDQIIEDYEDFKNGLLLFNNLTNIEFGEPNLSYETLGSLRELLPNTEINWVIHMGKWTLRTDDVAFGVLIFNFDYQRLTSEDIKVLKYCTKLQAIDLGHQAITDLTTLGEMKELRLIILADNQITDLTPLANLNHLHYIELFVNRIKDISPLANCKELVDLNISWNYGIESIEPIMDLPMLERLWIINDGFSQNDINRVKGRYPSTKIVTYDVNSVGSGWRTHERYHAMIDMFNKRNYISELFSKYDK